MARSELSSGAGRSLAFVYGVFAVAATARSAVQLLTAAGEAPLAYSLSLLAAVVYVVATVCLVRGGARAWRVAVVACSVELVGVVVVGLLSLTEPELFPDATVWSDFGVGYGFVPLVLPVLGLLWLRRVSTDSTSGGFGPTTGGVGPTSGGVGPTSGEERRPGEGGLT